MNRLFRVLAIVAASLALAGCITVGAGERPEVELRAIADPAIEASSVRADWHLLVDVPGAAQPLDGPRIVLSPRPGEFGVYAGVRWTDDAPRMVQSLIVRAFERSGRVAAVAPVASSARADRLLEIDLDAFHAAYEQDGDAVRVALAARLIDAKSNRIVGSRRFEARIPLESRRIDAVVAGFDRAVAEVVPELVEWASAAAD
jgi:cholesterol transport system auxiliary component